MHPLQKVVYVTRLKRLSQISVTLKTQNLVFFPALPHTWLQRSFDYIVDSRKDILMNGDFLYEKCLHKVNLKN